MVDNYGPNPLHLHPAPRHTVRRLHRRQAGSRVQLLRGRLAFPSGFAGKGGGALIETIRQLRAAGRKRATLGEWKVTIGQHYATFEPKLPVTFPERREPE
jgi:hypothetical protein